MKNTEETSVNAVSTQVKKEGEIAAEEEAAAAEEEEEEEVPAQDETAITAVSPAEANDSTTIVAAE